MQNVCITEMNDYALVDFEADASLSVVPLSAILNHSDATVLVGTTCSVKWEKKIYKATILAIGMFFVYYIAIFLFINL